MAEAEYNDYEEFQKSTKLCATAALVAMSKTNSAVLAQFMGALSSAAGLASAMIEEEKDPEKRQRIGKFIHNRFNETVAALDKVTGE